MSGGLWQKGLSAATNLMWRSVKPENKGISAACGAMGRIVASALAERRPRPLRRPPPPLRPPRRQNSKSWAGGSARSSPSSASSPSPASSARCHGRHGLGAQGRDGRAGIQQSGGAQLLQPRQGLAAFQAEMIEEGIGGDPGDRPARCLAPALGPDPARLQQRIQRAAGERHAADFLHLGPGDRLLIGDDGQRLDGRARELAGDFGLDLQLVAEVGRGAEGPAILDLDQMNAAIGIEPAQFLQQAGQIGAFRQAVGQRLFADRARPRRTGSPPAGAAIESGLRS